MKQRRRKRIIAIISISCAAIGLGEPQPVARETRISGGTIQEQLDRVPLPKNTADEKRIIKKALEVQGSHKKAYDRVKVGDPVFAHPGLIALGRINYYADDPGEPHCLTIGIRPRYAGENSVDGGFSELIIRSDREGIVTRKQIPRYKW